MYLIRTLFARSTCYESSSLFLRTVENFSRALDTFEMSYNLNTTCVLGSNTIKCACLFSIFDVLSFTGEKQHICSTDNTATFVYHWNISVRFRFIRSTQIDRRVIIVCIWFFCCFWWSLLLLLCAVLFFPPLLHPFGSAMCDFFRHIEELALAWIFLSISFTLSSWTPYRHTLWCTSFIRSGGSI